MTHVAAPVLLLHRLDVQVPRQLVRVADTDPGIVCYDVFVDGLNGLGVLLDPADLREMFVGRLVVEQRQQLCFTTNPQASVFNCRFFSPTKDPRLVLVFVPEVFV